MTNAHHSNSYKFTLIGHYIEILSMLVHQGILYLHFVDFLKPKYHPTLIKKGSHGLSTFYSVVPFSSNISYNVFL